MKETHSLAAKRRELLFIAACAAVAVLCAALAVWFAVPLQAASGELPPDSTSLSEYWRVDLNTADAEALCTLPGVGPSRARALVEYREQNGPFARVADAAAVPGLTKDVVASWEGQAYVSTTVQPMPQGILKGE